MSDLIIPVVLSIVSTAFAVFLFIQYRNLQSRFEKLTRGIQNKDLVELVSTFSKQQITLSEDIEAIHKEFSRIKEDTKRFFRKVGLVRYQGFSDTGGDQSFSIVLLDETDSGFVLTNLYGRGFSKTYAKRIEQGKPSHTLTDEEQEALLQAQHS
jgi:hypothetical protein